MPEYNLLKSLPKSNRNIKERNTLKSDEHIRVSREYGQMYFDGPREYGYGGYYYDGRWKPVAKDIYNHYKLIPENDKNAIANNPVKIMVIPRPLNPLGILEYLSLYLIVDISSIAK